MTNEELLDLVKRQSKENEEFRNQVIDAVRRDQERGLKKYLRNWLDRNGQAVTTALISAIIQQFFSWLRDQVPL